MSRRTQCEITFPISVLQNNRRHLVQTFSAPFPKAVFFVLKYMAYNPVIVKKMVPKPVKKFTICL